ncbi:hypothetical protein KXX35_009624, partial [Aspergillus fumigatus]
LHGMGFFSGSKVKQSSGAGPAPSVGAVSSTASRSMSARGVPQVREPKKEFSIFVGVEGISPRSLKSESGGYLQPPSRANDIRNGKATLVPGGQVRGRVAEGQAGLYEKKPLPPLP